MFLLQEGPNVKQMEEFLQDWAKLRQEPKKSIMINRDMGKAVRTKL